MLTIMYVRFIIVTHSSEGVFMEKFTPTQFRANSSEVFNAVQKSGSIVIESKNRPEMVLMLRSEHLSLMDWIHDLTKEGDAKD